MGDVMDDMQEAGCPIAGLTVLGHLVGDRVMGLGGEVRLFQPVAKLVRLADCSQRGLQHQRQHQADGGQPVQEFAAVAGCSRHWLVLDSERAFRASDRISSASLTT